MSFKPLQFILIVLHPALKYIKKFCSIVITTIILLDINRWKKWTINNIVKYINLAHVEYDLFNFNFVHLIGCYFSSTLEIGIQLLTISKCVITLETLMWALPYSSDKKILHPPIRNKWNHYFQEAAYVLSLECNVVNLLNRI